MKINSTLYFENAKKYWIWGIPNNKKILIKTPTAIFLRLEQMQIILIPMSSTEIIKGQITRGDFEWL